MARPADPDIDQRGHRSSLAYPQAKLAESYWRRHHDVVLRLRSGAIVALPTRCPKHLGPLLMRCLFTPAGAAQFPPVPVAP